MLPEVRMARILDAISSHRAGRLRCVEAEELLGFSERHFRRLRNSKKKSIGNIQNLRLSECISINTVLILLK